MRVVTAYIAVALALGANCWASAVPTSFAWGQDTAPPSTPATSAVTAANAPSDPDQTTLRSLGEAAIKAQLIDPYSAVFEWSPKPFVHVTDITKGKWAFKHMVVAGDSLVGCGTVNAKNRMGGYVGRVMFDVAIQNGQAVLAEMDSPDDEVALSASFCQSLGF